MVNEMTDAVVILSANQAFYDAFSTASFDLMKNVWSSREEIVCIHPGWAPLYGQEAVMQSWSNILMGGHSPKITCHNAIAHFLKFDLCFVTCFESLQGGTMAATNIFLNEENSWKMIHHHAAPTAQHIPHTSNDNSRLQ